MIRYIKGDLFETDAPIIVHGCNCQGVMCSGVAKQVKEKYPEAYNVYKETETDIGLELGDAHLIETNGKIFINLLTQEFYGRDENTVYVDYDAVWSALKLIPTLLEEYGFKTIAMPKIGCGLGNGDWNIVSKIIEEELSDFEVLVYEL